MPLTSADILFYYTNGATQATNTLSIGGAITATTIADNTSGNVFDDVTGDESTSGDTEYRAIACKDTNTTYDMLNAKVWISGTVHATSAYDTISFALERTLGTTIQLPADESTAPDTLKFTIPLGGPTTWTVEGAPSSTISYGTLLAGTWFGIHLRRVVPAGATAYTNRAVTLNVQCETTASPIRSRIIKSFEINWTKDNFYMRPIELN